MLSLQHASGETDGQCLPGQRQTQGCESSQDRGLTGGGGLAQRWHRRASWTRWLGTEVAQEGFLEEVAWPRGGAGGLPGGGGLVQRWRRRQTQEQ